MYVAVRLICLGKCRQDFVKSGVNEYAKRLSKYCKFEYLECSKLPVFKDSFLVALDSTGTLVSSEGFASHLKKWHLEEKNIVFLVGGAEGLSSEIVSSADFVLSLGKITFPNELVRVVFVEQLYRAFTIVKGEKYHK